MTARNMQRKRCGARTRDARTCTNWAMLNGRCRMHGGKTPFASALPQFKDGRHSKYLPKDILERARAEVSDAELMSLQDEIRLMDELTKTAAAHLELGETVEHWARVKTLLNVFQRERAKASVDGMQSALHDLEEAIEQGAAQSEARREVAELLVKRSQLVATERRTILFGSRYLSAGQAVALVDALLGIVKRRVSDLVVQREIFFEVAALMQKTDVPGPFEVPPDRRVDEKTVVWGSVGYGQPDVL